MFYYATNFNGDITTWDTSSVTDMGDMFMGVSGFNQDISTKTVTVGGNTYTAWNTSSVSDMGMMFYNASGFNQDISNWDVGNVTNMSMMFVDASSFNQNLSGWDVNSDPNKVTNCHWIGLRIGSSSILPTFAHCTP